MAMPSYRAKTQPLNLYCTCNRDHSCQELIFGSRDLGDTASSGYSPLSLSTALLQQQSISPMWYVVGSTTVSNRQLLAGSRLLLNHFLSILKGKSRRLIVFDCLQLFLQLHRGTVGSATIDCGICEVQN